MANATRDEVVDICRDITCWTLNEIVGKTDEECIRWLQSVGIVPYLNESHFLCPETGDPTHQMSRRIKRDAVIKYSIYCHTCRSAPLFRRKREHALATNTWISRTHLPVSKVIQLTYGWIMKMPVVQMSEECQISREVGVDWYSFCREICGRMRGPPRIGGPGHTSYYHPVGDQTTNRVIIMRLPDLSHQTLLALIATFIEPDTILFSDGWLRHRENDLLALGMRMHYWVNHSEATFSQTNIDPFTGNEINVTTNHIEKVWKDMDEYIKSYQNDDHVDQYIDQFIYFKHHNFSKLTNGEKFGHYLHDIAQVFPGLERKPQIDPNETLILYNEPQ